MMDIEVNQNPMELLVPT